MVDDFKGEDNQKELSVNTKKRFKHGIAYLYYNGIILTLVVAYIGVFITKHGAGKGPRIQGVIFLSILTTITVISIVVNRRSERYYRMLFKSKARYEVLFNSMNDAIFIHPYTPDVINPLFEEVNDTACKMLNYRREELLKLSKRDIIEHDLALELKIRREAIGKGVSTFERVLISKDGRKIPVEIKTYLFEMDGKTMVQSIARDISKRKERERQLQESEARYRTLVENFPDGIVIHDSKGITYANKEAAKVIGYDKPSACIGESIIDIIHPAYRKRVKMRFEKMMKDGEILPPIEEKIVNIQGEAIDVDVFAIPYRMDGRNLILATARNIKDRKQKENLQKRVEEKEALLQEIRKYDEMKTEFFANISHELRTPINVILGTLQLFEVFLKDRAFKDLDEKIGGRLKVVKQNCYRLLRLVNNLIDMTKIDAGYYGLQLKNYNIIEVVEEISLSVADYIEGKGMKLIFDTDVEEKVMACDADKIERIMLNLLSNALKFTDHGGRIHVAVQDQGEHVLISVKDNGTGIPQDKIESLFERFSQVDKTLTRNHEGSGIGLSLVKSLVEMHGGSIWVESVLGEGSVFTMTLPVRFESVDEAPFMCEDNSTEGHIERIHIEFSDIYGVY